MEFEKLARTFEEQCDLLAERGMQFADRSQAIHYLSHINYYRLAAYWLPFEISRDPHQFAEGTSFELVLNNYLFDREFRLLLLDAIERIEISFRTQWAYHISQAFGPHGYLTYSKGKQNKESHFRSSLSDLQKHIDRSDELFIKHYRNTYDEELPPAWVSCEVMSLGLLSRFYSNLRNYEVRRNISTTYNFDEGFLEGFLEHLSYIRNLCAHHCRIWNRHLTVKIPTVRNKPPGLAENIYFSSDQRTSFRIYNSLVVIQHLMTIINPDSHWSYRLISLVEKYHIDTKPMGFPTNWKELPIWASPPE